MSTLWQTLAGVLVIAVFLLGCNKNEGTSAGQLGNPPAAMNIPLEQGGGTIGFQFTNANGEAISSSPPGEIVQLRDTRLGLILIEFVTSGPIDFSNVVAEIDYDTRNVRLVYFPQSTDKVGLTGNIVLHTLGDDTANIVSVCPSVTSLHINTELEGICDTAIFELTKESPSLNGYTWDNASTISGDEDCKVSVAVEDYTGGFIMCGCSECLPVVE